jgi:hypothetical protein
MSNFVKFTEVSFEPHRTVWLDGDQVCAVNELIGLRGPVNETLISLRNGEAYSVEGSPEQILNLIGADY